MSEKENKLIRAEFRRMLDKLIDSKIRPTATEIISVEQPLISLFEEVMYKLEKQQKEIEEIKQNRDEYKEEYIKLLNARYYNYISKDKIRKRIEEARKIRWHIPKLVIEYFEELLEE